MERIINKKIIVYDKILIINFRKNKKKLFKMMTLILYFEIIEY